MIAHVDEVVEPGLVITFFITSKSFVDASMELQLCGNSNS